MNYGLVLSVALHVFASLLLTLEFSAIQSKKFNTQQPITLDFIEVRDVDNIKTTTQRAKLANLDQQKTEKFYKEKEVIKKISINFPPKSDVKPKQELSTLKKDSPKTTANLPKKQEKILEKNLKPSASKPDDAASLSHLAPESKQDTSKTVIKKKQVVQKSVRKKVKQNDISKAKQQKKQSSEVDRFAKTVMQTLEISTSKKPQPQTSASNILGDSKSKFSKDQSLSLSEASYVRAKISQNWNTTYFTNAQELDIWVELSMKLNHGGEVYDIQIKNSKGKNSQHYQLFIDSTLTAIRRASPLDELLDDHYEIWKEMIISFTPQGIVY